MVTLCNCYNDDMYNNGLVFVIFYINRRSTDSTKENPLVVHEYNHYMLGVDKLDQLMAYYSFLHKSKKWFRKLFFWMLEVVIVPRTKRRDCIVCSDRNEERHLTLFVCLLTSLDLFQTPDYTCPKPTPFCCTCCILCQFT